MEVVRRSFSDVLDHCSGHLPTTGLSIESARSRRIRHSAIVDDSSPSRHAESSLQGYLHRHLHPADQSEDAEIDQIDSGLLRLLHHQVRRPRADPTDRHDPNEVIRFRSSPSLSFIRDFSMFQMVVERLFVPDLSKVDEQEKKVCAVAVTHLLCDAEAMVRGVYLTSCWLNLFQALLGLFQSSEQLQITSLAERKQQEAEDELAVGLEETPGLTRISLSKVKNSPDVELVEYTPAFSRLAFARKSPVDLFGSSIPDARCHLAKCLQTLTSTYPNQVRLLFFISFPSHLFVCFLVSQSDEQWLVHRAISSSAKLLYTGQCHIDLSVPHFFFLFVNKLENIPPVNLSLSLSVDFLLLC